MAEAERTHRRPWIPAGCSRCRPAPAIPRPSSRLLLRTAHHWGVHTGQIVYAAKAMKEGAFDELWMKTML